MLIHEVYASMTVAPMRRWLEYRRTHQDEIAEVYTGKVVVGRDLGVY